MQIVFCSRAQGVIVADAQLQSRRKWEYLFLMGVKKCPVIVITLFQVIYVVISTSVPQFSEQDLRGYFQIFIWTTIIDSNFGKVYKISHFLSKLNETFTILLILSEYQSVNEKIILFKGHSNRQQYMPNKPIKRGYKVYVSADSIGFVCEFVIYIGKMGDTAEKNFRELSGTRSNAITGGEAPQNPFRQFFQFYSAAKKLLFKGINASGTVRKGRKIYHN